MGVQWRKENPNPRVHRSSGKLGEPRFPLERVDPRVGIFLSPLDTHDGFYLSDINVTVEDRDALTQITEQLQDLLPAVTAHLSEHNRLEEWVAFFKLIMLEILMSIISPVNYFWMSSNLHKSETFIVHSMRFSPAVKEFFMQNVYVLWEDIKH